MRIGTSKVYFTGTYSKLTRRLRVLHLFVRCLFVTVEIIDKVKVLIVNMSMDRKTSVNGSLQCNVV